MDNIKDIAKYENQHQLYVYDVIFKCEHCEKKFKKQMAYSVENEMMAKRFSLEFPFIPRHYCPDCRDAVLDVISTKLISVPHIKPMPTTSQVSGFNE